MQVLFVLRFYHPDKTDKIDRLLHASSLKMAVKMKNCFKLPLAVFTLFGSVVKKPLGSCIQSIRI